MRRLLRWTFNTMAAASLLLCLATAGLWVRSYWVYDTFLAWRWAAWSHGQVLGTQKYRCFAVSYRGGFVTWFGWFDGPEDQPPPPWHFLFEHFDHTADPFAHYKDFGPRIRSHERHAFNLRTWVVPDWCLVSAFAVLPSIAAFRQIRTIRRRRHRSRLGLCPACGYDLRATPGRCPECGAACKAANPAGVSPAAGD